MSMLGALLLEGVVYRRELGVGVGRVELLLGSDLLQLGGDADV